MAFRLRFLQEFELDLFKAIDWYKNISIKNAQKLVEDVNQKLEYISKNPLLLQKLGNKKRKASLRTYPYKIIFEVRNDEFGLRP